METDSLDPDNEGSGKIRDHSAFLNGYTPEDEGLYDDFALESDLNCTE